MLIAAGLAWGVAAWRERTRLAQARRDLAAGRYAAARDEFAWLAARRPSDGQIEYALGTCERALGHVDAALDAWGRVPAASALATHAALERARLALEHGRLAVVEQSLPAILDQRGAVGEEAFRLARQLDLFSGRAYRINARIERRWRSTVPPAAELRTHWLFDTQSLPLGAMAETLERFTREAPNDDRVWLGQADLAARAGRYAEADAWLVRCEARRPDDPDVNRARLEWALDTGDDPAAARAVARIPAAACTAADAAPLAARLAAVRGDAAAERAAWQRRVALEPGDAAAWKRLAELAAGADAPLAKHARRRKAELDAASDEYRILMGKVASGDPYDPGTLARTAEALGRRFEARGWWGLKARESPDDPETAAALARLGRPEPVPAGPRGKMLADVLPVAARNASATSVVRRPAATVPQFHDIARTSGLSFVYDNDQSPLRRLPETMGGGLALLDYDGDGWLDVYAVQGGHFPPSGQSSPLSVVSSRLQTQAAASSPTTDNRQPTTGNSAAGDHLFRNRRDGTFEDVTASAGIAAFPRGFGHGVTVGDYDNDGRPDLFVTRWRSYALYRNNGDGTFADATEAAGLGGARGWPTSAAFGDLDGDGDLDLYVCHYLRWDPETSAPCRDPERPDRHVYCVPRAFEAEPDHVFRNDGGRFVDVTEQAGITDRDGRGLGVLVADLDGDGRSDIFVANDMTANQLYHNLGGFRFEELAEASGAASNGSGGYQAGMGIACGDVDGDGLPDLVVTNFYGESVTLYRNLGKGLFADSTSAAGLTAPTRFVLGFGVSLFDANNDGRLDLAIANGHVNDYRPALPYAMPAQLILGGTGGRFVDATDHAGACWSEPRVGRGLAVGDLDNDGRLDVLTLNQNGPLAVFRNDGPAGRWLTLQLEGTASNRDAIGAVVRVATSSGAQTAWRVGGGSFLSASAGRLHLGLGTALEKVGIEVRWPKGERARYDGLEPDRAYRLVEGDARPRLLEGWPAPR